MGKSLLSEIRDIRDLVDRVVNGEFPVRSPIGPGQIQSKNIRARAITAPLINVGNLEAVNTQTGNLSVDGTIDVSTNGKIVSGTRTTDWTTFTTSPGGGLGYFHEYHATYGARVAFGNFNDVTGQYVKWDGVALSIKGIIVASAGTIAGWTITTDAIQNSGADVGMASSGHGGYAFWAGDSTPANAEYSVTSGGALVASSATITGAITASSGSITGTLTVGGSGGIHLNNGGAKIYSGMTAILTGAGFWLERQGGNVVFALGDGTTEYIYWNGSALQIQGELRATSGRFTGSVTLGTFGTGSLSSGQSAYDSGTGFWLERNSGTPRFSIGNSAGNKLTWNGTTLAVTGTLTATAGTIGGWTLSSTTLTGTNMTIVNTGDITAGTGSNVVRISSSDAGYRLWAGNATAASAAFSVSTTGVLYATGATVSGAITATSGSFTGAVTATSGSFTNMVIAGTATFSGSMTLPGGGQITSSTLDLNSGTMAGLTIDGTLTMASGGKILLSAAGRIEDADGSYWDQSGITLLSPTSIGDTVDFKYTTSSFRPYSSIQSSGVSTGSQLAMTAYYGNGATYTSQPGASVITNALSTSGEALLSATASGILTQLSVFASTTATSSGIDMSVHNRNTMKQRYTDYATSFGGRIYPGPESGSYQTARYIKDSGTYIDLQGPVNIGNSTVGGSNANWSTFTVANIPDKTAAYVVLYINGSAYRVPVYGNA